MQELVRKLNGEIHTFTLVQFIGFALGLLSSLAFYLYGKETGSETGRVVAIFVAGLAFLLAGLCDFFIHRSAGYYPRIEELCSSIAEKIEVDMLIAYEKDKRLHKFRSLVPLGYFLVIVAVTLILWDGVIKTYLADHPLVSGFYMLSLGVFVFGALWGRRGWNLVELHIRS